MGNFSGLGPIAQISRQVSSAPHLIHRHPDGTEEWLAVLQDPDGRPLAIMAQVRV